MDPRLPKPLTRFPPPTIRLRPPTIKVSNRSRGLFLEIAKRWRVCTLEVVMVFGRTECLTLLCKVELSVWSSS
eukprot:1088448-Amphidinium_carterae.1